MQVLGENLALESQALLRRDETILAGVDHWNRLAEMQRRLRHATATGTTAVDHYRFDTRDVTLLVRFGKQTGLSLAFEGRGTLRQATYDAAGNPRARRATPGPDGQRLSR